MANVMSDNESNGSLNDSNGDSSGAVDDDSSGFVDTVDDTNADPTCDPNEPSTSATTFRHTIPNPLFNPRPEIGNLSTSDDDFDDNPRDPDHPTPNIFPAPVRPKPIYDKYDDFSSFDEEVNQNPNRGKHRG